jgi:hypothetical protein
MKKSELVNMVMFVPQAIDLRSSSIALLDRIVWRANDKGKLLKPNHAIISLTDCAKMIRMSKRNRARALEELKEKNLIYCNRGGGGGLVVSEISRLYAVALSTWGKGDDDDACTEDEAGGSKNVPPGANSAPPCAKMAPQEVPTWHHNDNYHVHTHTTEAIDMKGEVTSEVEASQEGAKASKKELLVPPRMTPSAA